MQPSPRLPSRKPFLKRRASVFMYRMRPEPVVLRPMAFCPHWSAIPRENGGPGVSTGCVRSIQQQELSPEITFSSPRTSPAARWLRRRQSPELRCPSCRPRSPFSDSSLTSPLAGSRVAARRADVLLVVVAGATATTAQSVRLVAALTCKAFHRQRISTRLRAGPSSANFV